MMSKNYDRYMAAYTTLINARSLVELLMQMPRHHHRKRQSYLKELHGMIIRECIKNPIDRDFLRAERLKSFEIAKKSDVVLSLKKSRPNRYHVLGRMFRALREKATKPVFTATQKKAKP